jgi:hypothetical protein
MASDFQHQKIAGVFAAMDADGDGYLTERDFRALTTRWISLRGDGDHTQLTTIMMGWWTTLRDAAGTDRVTFWAGDNPAAPGSCAFGFFPTGVG